MRGNRFLKSFSLRTELMGTSVSAGATVIVTADRLSFGLRAPLQ
jgi:hypothetical protein